MFRLPVFFIGVGPYFAYNANSIDEWPIRKFDAGIDVNLGVNITPDFFVRLRGQYGFTNVMDIPVYYRSGEAAHTFDAGFTFGYMFLHNDKKPKPASGSADQH